MSKRIECLYNYIRANTSFEQLNKITEDAFCMWYKINANYNLDIIVDNETVNSGGDIVEHYYNYPKASVYVYRSTIESTNDPFNGKKVYGEKFTGETYELFQGNMVRLHFEKINRDELEDIMYIVKIMSTKE